MDQLTPTEKALEKIGEELLIEAYVPEAAQMTYQDALELAIKRDIDAVFMLTSDFCPGLSPPLLRPSPR